MTWRKIQKVATDQPAATAIALYAIVAIGAFLAAYFGIFSEFAPYDDEGTLLVTLKAFVHGDALYREIWSVYGPFYYEPSAASSSSSDSRSPPTRAARSCSSSGSAPASSSGSRRSG